MNEFLAWPSAMHFDHLPGIGLMLVPGYDGKYAAGTDGKIYCFSGARVNANKDKPFPLAERLASTGYLVVSIIVGDKRRPHFVHSLVCLAYRGIAPRPNMVVRHLDGSKINNEPGNILWGTYAENEADKRRHGRVACGESHGHAKLTEEAVRIIRASVPYGLWNANDAAQVFAVDVSTINRIARGEVGWKHVPSPCTIPQNIDSLALESITP